MLQKKRPIEIILLAWFTIGMQVLVGAIWLIFYFVALENEALQQPAIVASQEQMSAAFLEAFPFLLYAEELLIISMAFNLTAAIGLLRSKNWARILFIVLTVQGPILSYLTTGSLLLAVVPLPLASSSCWSCSAPGQTATSQALRRRSYR